MASNSGYSGSKQSILLGRGKLYFDMWDTSDVSSGHYHFLGVAQDFTINPDVKTLDVLDDSQQARGIYESIVTETAFKVNFTLIEYTTENLKYGLLADTSTKAQSSSTAADELHIAYDDGFTPLSYEYVSSVVVQNILKNVTYTLDTDYKLDTTRGWLYTISSGAITEGQSLYISYSYAAKSVPTIRAAYLEEVEGKMYFSADNKHGDNNDVEIWHVKLSLSAALDFITQDKIGLLKFQGSILSDSTNHANEPYFRILNRTTAT